MYFIARNNKIYNYIAHTSLVRRYMMTFGVVCAFFVGGMYLIYYPLVDHIVLCKAEHINLQKKYDELIQMNISSQELSGLIESSKTTIGIHGITADKQQEECHKKMLFVLDTIAQLGLKLNAYGSCNTKDKQWYIKDSAQFDIVGSIEKIMKFLETIKNSRHMITITQATITRIDDTTFKINCELGLITIKK
jgi:hypothetical protein